jgi:UDP-N-acetylmuramoyl-tripeptide--D-alanyl-D-alanine ligase
MTDALRRPEMLWSPLGLVAPLEARVSSALAPGGIYGISIDTRSLQPGDLFFALKGEASDGHDFLHTAFEKGAAAAVVSEDRAITSRDAGPLYAVHDVLAALERLGRAARARSKAQIVAVTGSVGKTSTKEALRLVLGEQGPTHAADKSYNNHFGVPLTLARMPQTARYGVFEIGMNHAGEIAPLTAMVRPHVAIVTTIGAVHLEYLGTLDAVADAKAEIFSGLEPGGTAIIHRDIAQFERLRDSARNSPAGVVLSFGEAEDADIRLLGSTLAADHSMVTARIGDRTVTYRLGAPGKHLVVNSLAVLAAAQAARADLDQAMAALAHWAQPVGRGERTTLRAAGGPFTLIDESYNANPMSMQAALALLGQTRPGWLGRRIAVLGDMLELGSDAPAMHADLAKAVADSQADMVFAAGPLIQNLFESIPEAKRGAWAERTADIIGEVLDVIHGGDVVMVKGSNGSRMSTLVAALKQRFAMPAETGRP